MEPEPRQPVLRLSPVVHGGVDLEELQRLGLSPDSVLDFSTNVNPYGPAPAVRAALAGVCLDRYPDRDAPGLRAALTQHLGIPSERIVVGNGTSELIWLVALAYVRSGDTVLVVGPTYGEYARAAQLMGGRVTTWLPAGENDFIPDPKAIELELQRLRPRVVFVCNPNNPTGTVLASKVVVDWARQYPKTLFVVDEAYQPFAPNLGSVLGGAAENVLVLRSMTKDFGLAGLRLGFAVGSEAVADVLRNVQPPWSVNALAQAAGVAALGDLAHRARSLQLLRHSTQALVAGLTSLGLPPLPSAVPFFLIHVGDGAAFRLALLQRRILVRDCASFGLPAYVRICTRRPEENERLLTAIREVR